MSPTPLPTDPAQAAAPDLDPDTQRHLAMLNEMIEMGVDITRTIHKQIKAQAAAAEDDATVTIDPALPLNFDRIVRRVSKAMLLFRELAKPLPLQNAARRRLIARQTVIRVVEDNIHRHAPEDEADALHTEMLDRLDTLDIDEDLATRPVADIIADICRDLGLAAVPGNDPWKRRTPADVATLNARAAASPGAIHAHPAAPNSDPRPQTLHRIRSP